MKMPSRKKKPKKPSNSVSDTLYIRKSRRSRGSNKAPKSSEKKPRSQRSPRASYSKKSLQPLREQLQVLVDQANKRVEALAEAGKTSRALTDAIRSWNRQTSRTNDPFLFKADLKRRSQIEREFARVHSFLNDYTSTLQGAYDFETDMSRLVGSWKHDPEDFDWSNRDIKDERIRAKSFELYRRVVEAAGGWERAVGLLKGKESLIGYGSENMINNIYDMVENEVSEEDIIAIALEQVEAGIAAYEAMASKQRSDYDYGIVFDDEYTSARRNFYMNRFNYRKKNRGY